MEKLPEYELLIEDVEDGMTCISLVDDPAIQTNWFAFSEIKEGEITVSFSKTDEQILTSPVMIPNKKILRINEAGDKYNIFFSNETIKEMRNKFFQDELIKNISVMHTDKTVLANVVESWIIEDANNDKAKALGFDLPKGTWMVSVKINDSNFWNDMVKSKAVKGFSLEGMFKNKQVFQNLNINKMSNDKGEVGLMDKILDFFRSQEEKEVAREKRQNEKDLEQSKINKMLTLSIMEGSKVQQFGTSGAIKQKTINLGNGKSIVFNDLAEAKLLDNSTFQFSEAKDGQYVSENKLVKFEIRNGFGFENLEAEAEVELEATEAPAKEQKMEAKEITVIDGDSMWVGDDGMIYQSDLTTLYPDGEYKTSETETVIIQDGKIYEKEIEMSTQKEFQKMQSQIDSIEKSLNEQVKLNAQLVDILQKNSLAKDIKIPNQTQLGAQKETIAQTKHERLQETRAKFKAPYNVIYK